MHAFRRASQLLALLLGVVGTGASVTAQTPAADSGATGRITGRVVDAETGRPLQFAQVSVEQIRIGAQTDLDGRYTIRGVPVGARAVLVRLIGFKAGRIDNVIVAADQATVVNLALTTAPRQLQGIVVTADVVQRTSSEAGMLAMQKSAPSVSDGISAEAMSRAPTSTAADAITRVTGVSVVDNRFVVVRGLGERYSNTLLNGAELPSPEPTKKMVPLDIFPASLLESVVTTKTATPDRPADFAGGSVEIVTKEFPENRIAQFNVSQSYNSLSTFRRLAAPARTGRDHFGFDDGRRAMPAGAPGQGPTSEAFAEHIRNVWTGPVARLRPDLGLGANFGGQLGSRVVLGYVAAVTYSAGTSFVPDRLFQFFPNPSEGPNRGFVYEEAQSTVDWGAIFNLALRLGGSTKIGWKNLYTRNAEELFLQYRGFEYERTESEVAGRQVRYVERDFLQSQLTGDHRLPLLDARLEWKATLARATRDEPDNRQVQYYGGGGVYAIQPNLNPLLWFRFLDDIQHSGQADLAIPFRLLRSRDGQLKMGGMARRKFRDFDATLFRWETPPTTDPRILRLPPEQAFSPEFVGRDWTLIKFRQRAQPYAVDERIQAAYGMLDFSLWRLRLVGGARLEKWLLDLTSNPGDTLEESVKAHGANDLLYSANLTTKLTDAMNLRLASFQSVTRPDPRELSPDEYLSVVGQCFVLGNPEVRRARTWNADARWEFYPGGDELVSLGAFYKRFRDPIIETITLFSQVGCRTSFHNAREAINYGGEIELRKNLGFLPGFLGRFALGGNFTLVNSRVTIDSTLGRYPADLPLQSQSPMVANGSLSYTDRPARLSGSVLLNWFDDRVSRYGVGATRGAETLQSPNVIERGRWTLDAKVQYGLGRANLSLSARNLLDARAEFYQQTMTGRVVTGSASQGRGFSVGLGYEL